MKDLQIDARLASIHWPHASDYVGAAIVSLAVLIALVIFGFIFNRYGKNRIADE